MLWHLFLERLILLVRPERTKPAKEHVQHDAQRPHIHLRTRNHARRTMGIRTALLTTERLVWYCGAHTAK